MFGAKENLLRLQMSLLGMMGGLLLYLITNNLPDQPRLEIFLAYFTAAAVGSGLLLAGNMAWRRVLLFCLALGAVSALLLFWASLRFLDIDDSWSILESFAEHVAYIGLILIALPFIIARETATITDYKALFERVWGIFVKTCTACLFVGMLWGVLCASAYMLSLVGAMFLEDLLAHGALSAAITGGAFGLSLAWLGEMDRVVNLLRYLLVSLLRLLLPIVTIVTAVFLAYLPAVGLENIPALSSISTVVLWMAILTVTLITACLDSGEDTATKSRVFLFCAKISAVLLPIMAGVAIYGMFVRVADYGWTPDRIIGSLVCLVVLAYALSYAYGVIFTRKSWQFTLRNSNIMIAGLLMFLAILWQTPLLDAQKISADDQVARYFAGQTPARELPLWDLQNTWGLAGKAALSRLQTHAETGGDAALTRELMLLE